VLDTAISLQMRGSSPRMTDKKPMS
jgi:hypothetical protein